MRYTQLGERISHRLRELAPWPEGVRRLNSRNLGPTLSPSSVYHVNYSHTIVKEPEMLSYCQAPCTNMRFTFGWPAKDENEDKVNELCLVS